MIAVCTNCHAKFRVPEEKIGPRGAKVRCSRCSTVFSVPPDGTAGTVGAPYSPPARASLLETPGSFPGLDLEAGSAARSLMDDPFSTGPLDPFAPRAEPAAAAAAFPPPLPGTRAPTPPPSPLPADPFALGDGLGAPPSADPFAAAWPPGGAPDFPQTGGTAPNALPLTDLSDLLGPMTPVEVPCPAPEPEPVADAPRDDGGLALEDRLTPPPHAIGADPFSEPSASLPGLDTAAPALAAAAGEDPFAPGSGAFMANAYGVEPLPGEEALALAGERVEPKPAAFAFAEPAPAAHAQAREAPVEPARGGRVHGYHLPLRSIAVNAVALAALLAIALAMLAVWRSEGPFEIAMLRPSALVASLRTVQAPPPFSAAEVRSGIYERQKGSPVLFVRGRIVSRATRPVRAVRVAVEVVRDGEVVARGSAFAGAVPTPEEIWTAPDARALELVTRAASSRAPSQVRPGDRVPFLVAIAEHPSDLDGATLRLDLSPAEGKAP